MRSDCGDTWRCSRAETTKVFYRAHIVWYPRDETSTVVGGGSVMTCVQQRQASGFRNTRYINRSLIKVSSQLNILLEKLTVSHVVKKFPCIYGTRRFITAMCAHSCAILIRSTLFIPFPCDVCQYYSPRCSRWSVSGCPTKTLCTCFLPPTSHTAPTSLSFIWWCT